MVSFGEIAKKREPNSSIPLYPMLKIKEMETGEGCPHDSALQIVGAGINQAKRFGFRV
jgi:hypothetical protein